jgi:amidophosphoribosyltransferase
MSLNTRPLGPREACGIFAIYGHPDAVRLTYLGLYALQHRGQESTGIVSSDRQVMMVQKGMGLVGDVFSPANLAALKGDVALGHVRYSTTGSSVLKNAQPLMVDYSRGTIAVAHNGNLTNAAHLREQLEARGSIFQTTSDSEIILHILAGLKVRQEKEAVLQMLQEIRGAYCLAIMKKDEIIAIRDPNGFRPLSLGEVDGAYVVASESCALDLINATFIREIEPGEVLIINAEGLESLFPFGKNRPQSSCIFEYIYFARPDSFIFGANVHEVRKRFGVQMAREHPVDADLVIAIPDCGVSAAIGYAQESGLPFDMGVTRNHYIGRTFLQPRQAIRDFGVKVKLNPVREVIRGKRLVVAEDSVVRGTTTVMRMASLREAGAKEIHLRISCPPHRFPCFYGIDFATKKELIASSKSVGEIARYLNIDSLGYLSREGMLSCLGEMKNNFCTACFDGNYPVPVEEKVDKYITETDRLQEYMRFPESVTT